MKKFAVVVAGGSGLRMGTGTPKQFLLLKGKMLLWHSVNSFLHAYSDLQVIVVLPQAHLATGEILRQSFPGDVHRIHLTAGGETRFHSVKNGLDLVEGNSIVFVHDAVRCLVTKDLICCCYEQAVLKGSAIPAVVSTDSTRILNGEQHNVVDRNKVQLIQTPQTFTSDILLPAFQQAYQESFTDEATVVEAFGKEVFLCPGDYNNIKITRPIDLIIAEALM